MFRWLGRQFDFLRGHQRIKRLVLLAQIFKLGMFFLLQLAQQHGARRIECGEMSEVNRRLAIAAQRERLDKPLARIRHVIEIQRPAHKNAPRVFIELDAEIVGLFHAGIV